MHVGTVEISNGESLFYREMGQGKETLLLIHGNMSASIHWKPIYEKMQANYRIYALDIRGMGNSSYHHSFDTIGELAEDVADFCRALGLSQVIAVGWSMGGGVVMELAAAHPELVKKGILITPAPYDGYPVFVSNATGEVRQNQPYQSKEAMAKDPVKVVPMANALASGNKEAIKAIWDAMIYVVQKPPAQAYQQYLEGTMQQRNLIDILWALNAFNLSDKHNGVSPGSGRIHRLEQPMLLVGAKYDGLVPTQKVAEAAAAIGENATYHLLQHAGHSPLTDAPEELMSIMEQFIEKRH